MGRVIDERVVEMRFDNKQFESGVKESLSTLQRLKEALNFSTSKNALKGLDKAAANVSLDGIAEGVAALERRFSTLGIVGMRAIENITDSMMGLVSRGIKYVDDAIVSGGIRRAMNIENARFQLQSILQDEQRVAEVMDSASKSVDGTAYSFDVAAKAASQFTASGINDIDKLDVALRAVAGTTATYNADYESMAMIFTQVAGQGRVMGDQLLQLSTRGANAAVTIKDFVNGVNSGAIQVDDTIRASVQNISTATNVTEADIRDLVSKGKVDFMAFAAAMEYAFGDSAAKANETFTGALANIRSAFARIGEGFISPLIAQNSEVVRMFNAIRVRVNDVKKALVFDEEIGNVNALSKQFSDSVLLMAKGTATFLENLDMTKPMQAFYNGVEALKNVFKGFGSILSPVAKAFADVFLAFSIDDVVTLTDNLETLTSKFRLSERSSKNLHDTFEGLFSIVKLLSGGLFGLIGLIMPLGGPVDSLAGAFLTLTGAAGRALSVVTGWISKSTILRKAYDLIGEGLQNVMSGISGIIQNADDFLSSIDTVPVVVKFVNALGDAFIRLGEAAAPYVEKLINKIKELKGPVEDFISDKANEMVASFIEGLDNLADALNELDFTKPAEMFDKFIAKLKEFRDIIMGNSGVAAFIKNMSEYFEELQANVNFDKLFDNIDEFRERVGGFVTWIKDTLGPSFGDLSIGGILAGGAGLGMVGTFLKMAKTLEGVSTAFQSFPNALNAVSNVLKSYQEQIKAEAIKKIATAILILAGALVLLSFADNERLLDSAIALSLISGALLYGISKLGSVMQRGKTLNESVFQFSKGFGKAMKNLSKAVKIKALGSAVKDFAFSIAIIVGSIVALALMYRKDSEAIMAGFEILKQIAIGAAAVMIGMSLLGQVAGKGMKNFAAASAGVLMLSLSLATVVGTLQKLFKMELPDDWETKLDILKRILIYLGVLTVVLGLAGRLAGGAKASTTPLIGLSVALISVVWSLKKLFEIDLPDDYEEKTKILRNIMIGLGALMLVIAGASRLAGGGLKAAGTILAMCAFIAVVVAALAVLTLLPGEKLLKSAVALGAVLVALALALTGAGTITNDNTHKTVLAMAITVAAIVAALGILSMVPIGKLAKAVVALGAILLVLATNFKAIGSITDQSAIKAVVGMIAMTVTIVYSLYILAEQPWEGILSAAASLSAVLLSMAVVFKTISNANDINLEKIVLFLGATIALAPIAIALKDLSEQPWEGMLAAGTAMSAVLLAFGAVFKIAASSNPDLPGIAMFLAATLAILPIALALYVLSEQPWEGLLSAAASISATLLAVSAAMAICTAIGGAAPAAIAGIGLLDAFIANFALVLTALGAIFSSETAQNLLGGGQSVLAQIGNALGSFVGNIVGGFAGGIADALPGIGQNLSDFMNNASGFFSGSKNIDASTMQGVKFMAETILILTGAAILDGLTSWLTGGRSTLSEFGKELMRFGPYLASYSSVVKSVDGGAVQASANAAKIMADMSRTLPASGGLAQKIFGEKKLSEFGRELVQFGPLLSNYSASIKSVDGAAVETSANAAKMMAELANQLPASGGLVEKIFGEKKLSEFGKELASFGPHLMSYSESIKGLDGGVVTASANAAKSLSELANNLPKSGGLAGLFGGEQDISAFGKNLKSFGQSFKGYYDSISGIGVGTITATNTAITGLISLAQTASGIDTTGMTGFVTGLETMAQNGITKFCAAFQNSGESITAAIDMMASYCMTAIQSKNEDFTAKGTLNISAYILGIRKSFGDLSAIGIEAPTKVLLGIQFQNANFMNSGVSSASKYIAGISSKNGEAVSTGQTSAIKVISGITSKNEHARISGSALSNMVLTGIRGTYGEANSAGQGLGTNTISGISSKNGEATSAGKGLGNSALSGVNSVSGEFTSAGVNAGQGFINGMGSLRSAAAAAGREIAKAALKAAEDALDEHSPSEEMRRVGSYGGEGFVDGLLEWLTDSSKAGQKIADTALISLKETLNDLSNITDRDLDLNPVVRPLLDTEEFEQSLDEINRKFNQAILWNAVNVGSTIGAIDSPYKASTNQPQNGQLSNAGGNTFTMIQNNYSPKALSRIDIYRDTLNEISRFKEVIDNI